MATTKETPKKDNPGRSNAEIVKESGAEAGVLNMKRLHDEFLELSIDLTKKNNLHFQRYMKNAENHDDSRQNYAEQALSNCVTFCKLLDLTFLDKIVNLDEANWLFAEKRSSAAAIDAKIVDTIWSRIESKLEPVLSWYNKVQAEAKK